MENMQIYNAVRSVPQEAQKQFNNGSFSGTDINPMWRIKTLTEQFGPAGFGWYYTVKEHWTELVNEDITTNVIIELFVKMNGEWSMPIIGIGGNKTLQQFKSGSRVSDEGYKMALTDAISVAAKALGIGADVYWGADKTKYTATQPQQPTGAVTNREKEMAAIIAGTKYTLSNVTSSSLKNYHTADLEELTQAEYDEFKGKWAGACAQMKEA